MNIKDLSKEDREEINGFLETIKKNEREFSCFQYFFERICGGIGGVLMFLFPWIFLLCVDVPIIRWFGFALPIFVIYYINTNGKKPKRLSYIEKSKNVVWAMDSCISIIENSGLIKTDSGIAFIYRSRDDQNSTTYQKFIEYFPSFASFNLKVLANIKWD